MLLVEALYIWYGAVAFSGRARTSDDDPRVLFQLIFAARAAVPEQGQVWPQAEEPAAGNYCSAAVRPG